MHETPSVWRRCGAAASWHTPGVRFLGPDHIALTVTDVDLDELAASGRFEVLMGPADLFGAQGDGRGLYISDPDGNRVELRTYA
jgi:hypothetical protein